jgi:hypothetical protein
MNHAVTNSSALKGCFWNPKYQHFSCVVSYDSDMTIDTSECKASCPKACPEHYWKCNFFCIPIIQKCDGQCMPYYTYNCIDRCIPVNKPCNGICRYDNYVNCKGECLDSETKKELIFESGCEGKIPKKFALKITFLACNLLYFLQLYFKGCMTFV